MKTLKLKLVTPVKTIFDEDVEQVHLNTEDGEITVLPNHAPLVSILRPGILTAKQEGKDVPMAVAGGAIEMFGNTLVILADTAEHPDEIDLERAEKKAQKLAQEIASKQTLDITTYKTLQRQLEREQARIGAVKRWRK